MGISKDFFPHRPRLQANRVGSITSADSLSSRQNKPHLITLLLQ